MGALVIVRSHRDAPGRRTLSRGIRLFVLPPRSPKLNGAVERANRTHTEEFYDLHELDWTVAALNRQTRAWERVYNTVRPHQALGYRTPQQFLREFVAAPPPEPSVTNVPNELQRLDNNPVLTPSSRPPP